MNLVIENWNEKDIENFQKYLKSLEKNESKDFTKKVVNTKREVLAIPSKTLKGIAKQISKGDIISFLNKNLVKYHENTIINAYLLGFFKDFETFKKYLLIHIAHMDNWASVDLIPFNIVKRYPTEFLNLSKALSSSNKVFERRASIVMLMKLIDKNNLQKIFDIISSLKTETEYYVNMAIAWLLCDCFIKQKDLTISFLDKNLINNEVVSKFVQKCRNSFRVSCEDKTMLLKYKKIYKNT